MDTQVNFRTNKRILARADKVFESMGMDRSTALNMFLTRVEAEEGLPFRPSANIKAIREKWDREVVLAKKTKGYKNTKVMMRAILR
ncbi:MAG: type II toxin-antitoxin system RelB/DinJ family antitoxin [Candidatus Zambryskibacteria bacterium]|nr:type II toxin-antitoxin system RelB/DinJ family antitoxin [Candidatus Zambryskibacteria bacterium]